MFPLVEFAKAVTYFWFPWLKPCKFAVSVDLTTEIPTATVPAMKASEEDVRVRTIRTFEVTADSIEEAQQIALENARMAFSDEGYHVRQLTVMGAQAI